jgi:hypothetical protein
MKLGKSLLWNLCNSGGLIGYLQKLLYIVNRIRMSPTPTLNIYLFEGPIDCIHFLKNIVMITFAINVQPYYVYFLG